MLLVRCQLRAKPRTAHTTLCSLQGINAAQAVDDRICQLCWRHINKTNAFDIGRVQCYRDAELAGRLGAERRGIVLPPPAPAAASQGSADHSAALPAATPSSVPLPAPVPADAADAPMGEAGGEAGQPAQHPAVEDGEHGGEPMQGIEAAAERSDVDAQVEPPAVVCAVCGGTCPSPAECEYVLEQIKHNNSPTPGSA